MTDVPLSEKRLYYCTFLAIRQAAPTSSLSQVSCYFLSWIPWLLRTCANVPVNLSCSRAAALTGTSSEVVRDTLGSLPPAHRSADFPSACGSQSLKFVEIFPEDVLGCVPALGSWLPLCLLLTHIVGERYSPPSIQEGREQMEALQTILLDLFLEPGVAVLLGPPTPRKLW